jgi:hypothetical protein
VARICLFELLTNPCLDVDDVGKMVDRRLLARVERREADAEAEVVDVLLNDGVVGGCGYRWVDEQLEEGFASERPAFGISAG